MNKAIELHAVDHAKNLADWVHAAIECKTWNWDFDQFEAALHTLNDYRKAIGDPEITLAEIQKRREDLCTDEGCPHHGTEHVCRTVTDPWSTDLDAAPRDRKVLVCTEEGDHYVAAKSDSMRNAFCYAAHRGAFLMVLRVVKWREIPA